MDHMFMFVCANMCVSHGVLEREHECANVCVFPMVSCNRDVCYCVLHRGWCDDVRLLEAVRVARTYDGRWLRTEEGAAVEIT